MNTNELLNPKTIKALASSMIFFCSGVTSDVAEE